MPKLIITNDGEAQDEKVIVNENTTIGRAPDCDIVLDDPLVSRHHIRIICILGDCFLEDLNSANGTMVNERLTKKCPLEHGDSITVGAFRLKYDTENRAESAEDEFDKTRVQLIRQLSSPDEQQSTDDTPAKFTGDLDDQDATLLARKAPDWVEEQPKSVPQEEALEINAEEELNAEQTQHPAQSRVKAENPKERVGNIRIISGSRQGHNMALSKSVTSIDRSGQRVAAVTRRPDGYFLVPLGDGSPDNISVVINGEEINRRIFPLWSNDIIELDGTEMEFGFSD
jgi:pSer/pThr/pTyr-binding forkhead associated (FHA) protein